MTGTAVLNALFGAALVAIGVLAAALADRIRGIRPGRTRAITESHELPTRAAAPVRAAASIEVIEPVPSAKPERARAPRSEAAQVVPLVERLAADDVIAALVAAGYKRPVATEATWGCSQAERATIENWTRAALRRCAKGAAS